MPSFIMLVCSIFGFILIIEPIGHDTPTLQTQDTEHILQVRTTADSVGRSVLQTVAHSDCKTGRIASQAELGLKPKFLSWAKTKV